MIWLLPPPLSRRQNVSLSQSSSVSPTRQSLTDGGGEGDGAKSNDVEKAWSSIIY